MSATPKPALLAAADPEWLALHREPIIDPDLPIVDAHHHLWDVPRAPRYLMEELSADLDAGHNIVATVYMEASEAYRTDGPGRLRSLGETEFVAAFAKAARPGVCAGIVGRADLMEGAAVQDVLELHREAAGGRWRGIRNSTVYDATGTIRTTARTPPAGMMADRAFREGFACLAPLGMSFDVWAYHTQLNEVVDLARAFPDTSIILDHVGGPIGSGAYAGRRTEVFADWREGITRLASCENVTCKLGGLGMAFCGFGFDKQARPPSSEELAEAWAPYINHCIEAFGPERCMFESNFPVDQVSCSYAVLWNAFKRIAAGCSNSERTALFSGTAQRIYAL